MKTVHIYHRQFFSPSDFYSGIDIMINEIHMVIMLCAFHSLEDIAVDTREGTSSPSSILTLAFFSVLCMLLMLS